MYRLGTPRIGLFRARGSSKGLVADEMRRESQERYPGLWRSIVFAVRPASVICQDIISARRNSAFSRGDAPGSKQNQKTKS